MTLPDPAIAFEVEGRHGVYDRDRLATAILVYLSVLDEGIQPGRVRPETARQLRTEHGFELDSITYALAACAAVAQGIEP